MLEWGQEGKNSIEKKNPKTHKQYLMASTTKNCPILVYNIKETEPTATNRLSSGW